jgi:dipeptidyl aminopeptidase/acylaminoacyl peptidase
LISANYEYGTHTGSHIASRVLPWQWELKRVLRDGSADVIIEAGSWDAKGEPITVNLARLDTLTGISTNLSAGAPEHIEDWLVDDRGRPLAVWTGAGHRRVAYLHGDTGWSKWQDVSRFEGREIDPVAVGDNNSMFVVARGASDFGALYRYDVAARRLADQATVGIAGFDFDGDLVYDVEHRRLLGVQYESDAEGSVWLDAEMGKLQAEIDKKLPTTINRIDCGNCSGAPVVLVTTFADVMPPAYFLYRRETHELKLLGAARPWIAPKQMSQRDLFRIKARDGMSIPVLVTGPPSCSCTAALGYAARIGAGKPWRSSSPRAAMS